MKKSLVFILGSLSIGGAEKRTSTIASFLAEKGYDVKILLIESPLVKYEVSSKVQIVYLRYDNDSDLDSLSGNCSPVEIYTCAPPKKIGIAKRIKLKTSRMLFPGTRHSAAEHYEYIKKRFSFKIFEYLKSFPDSIIISCMTMCSLPTAIAKRMGLSNKTCFVECTFPESEYPSGHYINILKEKLYPIFDAAVFQTEEERAFYTYLKNIKSFVIPNPILGDYPERYIGERKKIVVNFCRLNKAKNLPLLIDAFGIFHKTHSDYKLIIYGEGSIKNELENHIADQKLGDCVSIEPFDNDIHKKIIDYAMFVSSSDREGISNSMLEAMSIGLPTICTDTPGGGTRLAITDHVDGIIVPLGNKNALCNAMKEIAEKDGFSKELSSNSVMIKNRLSVPRIGKMWIKAIESLY